MEAASNQDKQLQHLHWECFSIASFYNSQIFQRNDMNNTQGYFYNKMKSQRQTLCTEPMQVWDDKVFDPKEYDSNNGNTKDSQASLPEEAEGLSATGALK